jgi:hypothetical protein
VASYIFTHEQSFAWLPETRGVNGSGCLVKDCLLGRAATATSISLRLTRKSELSRPSLVDPPRRYTVVQARGDLKRRRRTSQARRLWGMLEGP